MRQNHHKSKKNYYHPNDDDNNTSSNNNNTSNVDIFDEKAPEDYKEIIDELNHMNLS